MGFTSTQEMFEAFEGKHSTKECSEKKKEESSLKPQIPPNPGIPVT